jgi:hypothetical protein
LIFSLVPSDNRNTRSTYPMSVLTGIGQTLMSRPDFACGDFIFQPLLIIFSSPGPKGHVRYCHHLASVVRRKLFQRYSPLKLTDQLEPNLVRIITRVSSFKIVSDDAVHQSTWPLLLKIEHMVKLQVLGNNSKNVNISEI